MRPAARIAAAIAACLLVSPAARAVIETDASDNFPVGSAGYQANIPSLSANLLALTGVSFTASLAPNGGEGTSTSYATLIDGSYGTTPNSGGGGPGEVAIRNGTTLTYTLPSPDGYTLSAIDVFSGWGDSGRVQPRFTVRYATTANPTTFLTLQDVNYAPDGVNGAWVSLSDLGLSGVAVGKIQFSFNNQQNGYVGYTELAVQGTVLPPGADPSLIWSGQTNTAWNTSTSNWSGAAYAEGNAVKFKNTNGSGGAVANTNIVIQAGGVNPSAVTFSNTAAVPYSLTNTAGDVNGIAGATSVTINGGGAVTFNSPNTYTGGTNVNLGTLTLGAAGTLGAATGTLSVIGGSTVNLGGTTQLVGQLGAGGATGIVGAISNGTLNVGTSNVYLQSGSFTANLTSTQRDANPGTQSRLWIGGDAAGTLLLGGVNTLQYSDTNSTIIGFGAVTGGAGIVRLLTPTALGPATENAQLFAGTLDLNGQANITVKTIALFGGNGSNLINSNTSTAATFAGDIPTTAGDPAIGGTGNMTLSGAITGPAAIRKTGAGTLTLAGVNSSYTGVTVFEGGIVNVAALADYDQNSSLGARPAASEGAQQVAMLFRGGTLQYTGATPQTTNRAIRISTNNGGATIDASGSVPSATLTFSANASPDFWENPGARTLTLTGSNSGDNTFAMNVADINGVTTTNLAKTGAGTWVLSNAANSYRGNTTVSAGTLRVTGSIPNSPVVNVTGGTFEAAVSMRLNSINVTGGKILLPAGGPIKVLTIGDNAGDPGTVSGTGKIDLTTHAMAVDVPDGAEAVGMAAIRALITTGRNNGNWAGLGITSSSAAALPGNRAIGYALATDILPFDNGATTDTFLGAVVDKSTIVVRYTMAGDADLDGTVGLNDLLRLANNYGLNNLGWNQGDFDYSGDVGLNDLLLLANNYGLAIPAEAVLVGGSPVAVPEPTAITGLILAAGTMLGRRARRSSPS